MVRLSANSIRVVADAEEDGFDATPAENVDAPDHVGAWLREAREATGRDLRDVAAHLRIRYPYLLAIEEGRFDDLPGRAYVVGFIRSYAGHLGLDAEAMVERYKADVDAVIAEQNLKFPTPAPEGRFPGRGALIASAILVAAAMGGWYYYQNRDAIGLDRVPPPPQTASVTAPAVPTTTGKTTIEPAAPEPMATLREAATAAEAKATAAVETAPMAASGVAEPGMPEPAATAPLAAEPVPADTATAETVVSAPAAPVYEQMAAAEPATLPRAGMTAPGERVAAANKAVETMAPAPAVSETPTGDASSAGIVTAAATPPEPVAPEPVAPEPGVSSSVSRPANAEAAGAITASAKAVASAAGDAAPAETAALPPPPPVTTTEEPSKRVYGLTNRDARVVLSARGESWVQVRDAAQTVLFTRTLQSGESYRVPNREGLLMRVGNPRMLDISIDGSVPVQLSDSDRPIQDVTLDPQVLRDALAVR
jgi:cytoskeleton protein RodZ